MARRHERVVGDVHLEQLGVVRGCLLGMLSLGSLACPARSAACAAVQLLGALIEQFVRGPTLLNEILRALEFLLRELLLRLELYDVVVRFIDSLFSLADLGVRH